MNAIEKSLNQLYEAFGDVPKPGRISGCPCCIDGKNTDRLLSKPLKAITAADLSSYAASAFLTVGADADYLYLLPRIVDITCHEQGWWPDIEVTGRAIGETKPTNWPAGRRSALMNVVNAVVDTAIAEIDGRTIDSWICAASKMGLDFRPLLEKVSRSPQALAAYYACNSEALIRDKLGNAFWDKHDPSHTNIVAWFGSPQISQWIAAGDETGNRQ
jgi:hypothetical protein